jgi:hypothetical protein
MKKFSKILESVKPDKEDILSYFDFVQDLDFEVSVEDCYIKNDDKIHIKKNIESIEISDISNWRKGILIQIKKESSQEISFSVDFGYSSMYKTDSCLDMKISDMKEFFDQIMNSISQLSEYNPIFGCNDSINYFIIFQYDKINEDEINISSKYSEVIKELESLLKEWFHKNIFSQKNPNGLKKLVGSRCWLAGLEILFFPGKSGNVKIRNIIKILTEGSFGNQDRSMGDIFDIKSKINKMGWDIEIGHNSYQIKLKKNK